MPDTSADTSFSENDQKQLETIEKTTYRRFPKLAVIGGCRTHLILGAITTRGSSVDVNQFRQLFAKVASTFQLKTILADALEETGQHQPQGRLRINTAAAIVGTVGIFHESRQPR